MKAKFKNGDIVVNKTTKDVFVVREYWGYCMINGNIYGAANAMSDTIGLGVTVSDKNYRKATDKDIITILSEDLRDHLTGNYWESI